MSRYNSRRKAINKSEMWKKTLEDRGVMEVEQYVTPRLKNPTEEELNRIQTKDYVWKSGDKLWRLASIEFGEPGLWWIIAKLNNKPTDILYNAGDIVKIPLNLTIALEVLG